MADDVNENYAEGTVKKLSHKLFKRLLQKEKRKLKRQKAAEARKQDEINEETQQEHDRQYRKGVESFEADCEKREALQREINEKLWLQREAEAQKVFARKKLEEERRIKQKEEQEKAIKLEWERQQEKENDEKERKEKATKDKEIIKTATIFPGILVYLFGSDAVLIHSIYSVEDSNMLIEALFREIEKEVTPSQSRSHNPVAPPNYGTERDAVNCSFFLKTGACRFGERCSRQHPRPSSGVTLLIPAMYNDIRHIESALDIADRDTGLEFDEQDAYKNFLEFYDDVYPEFEKSGRILQFKVCCNYEPHLRGNVYVQFTGEENCQRAFADFNGRWYAGRQLSCEFSPVTNWKSAICGLFAQNRCPRGKNCNFLHVYRNPDDWSEQRSENLRSDRNGWRYDERDRSNYSDRARPSSERNRSRNDEHRASGRDSYRYDRDYRDRRRNHRSRSRSRSPDDSSRKKRRRHRSRGKISEERDGKQLSSGSAVGKDGSMNQVDCNIRNTEGSDDGTSKRKRRHRSRSKSLEGRGRKQLSTRSSVANDGSMNEEDTHIRNTEGSDDGTSKRKRRRRSRSKSSEERDRKQLSSRSYVSDGGSINEDDSNNIRTAQDNDNVARKRKRRHRSRSNSSEETDRKELSRKSSTVCEASMNEDDSRDVRTTQDNDAVASKRKRRHRSDSSEERDQKRSSRKPSPIYRGSIDEDDSPNIRTTEVNDASKRSRPKSTSPLSNNSANSERSHRRKSKRKRKKHKRRSKILESVVNNSGADST